MSRRGRPAHADVLTPAEWRVVEWVRHGLSNPEIARRQGVSLDAVKFHVANVLNKLGLSTRRELRRWGGVNAASALRRAAKEIPMMSATPAPTGLVQIARTVADIEAARTWYGDVLGLAHLYSFPGMAFFACGEVRLYLHQAAAGTPTPTPESILYFRVGDIHAAHASLAAKDVEFQSAPHMIHRHEDGTEEWLAILQDNEGRPLGLMAQVKAAVATA